VAEWPCKPGVVPWPDRTSLDIEPGSDAVGDRGYLSIAGNSVTNKGVC
jgi:hypothetical protein